jgi:hypothetical protein
MLLYLFFQNWSGRFVRVKAYSFKSRSLLPSKALTTWDSTHLSSDIINTSNRKIVDVHTNNFFSLQLIKTLPYKYINSICSIMTIITAQKNTMQFATCRPPFWILDP